MRITAVAALSVTLGCVDPRPRPGEWVALGVDEILTEAKSRHGRQIDIYNAINQGASEESIAAGRLLLLTCALPGEASPETKWVVLRPEGMTLREGDIVSFRPGTR
jgi:hypothetical protein